MVKLGDIIGFNTTPFHGKLCRVEKNGTNLEYNVDWNLNIVLEMAAGQRMGQQWDEKYPGWTEWSGGFKGSFAPGNTEQKAFFDNIVTASIGTKITDVDFNLNDSSKYFDGDIYLTKLRVAVSKDGEVNFNINFKGSGRLTLTPNCGETTNVSYDSGNPETIARDDNVEITISDGIGPFTWTVSGTGFSLDDAVTTDRANTLRADGSACGSATIMVTDECSDTHTGYVRCTTGQWNLLCSGTNTAGTCAGRRDYYEYPDPATKLILGFGCHYSPYECIYYTCEGYTSHVPAEANSLCGSKDWTYDCADHHTGCRKANIYLTVHKWECA